MERALDIGRLSEALSGRSGLPSAEELQQIMADVEVQLILRRTEIPQALIDTGWYLHAVASVGDARERYTVARQRQAFLVSAHIFDLALSDDGFTRIERLSFGFAAAIGYRRGGRDPNATAIMNRLRSDIQSTVPILDHIDSLPLEVGLAWLGFETKTLFPYLTIWRRQLKEIATVSDMSDLTTTVFGPLQMVVLGAEDLLVYFTHGNNSRLQRGRDRLHAVAAGNTGPEDLNSRWVAAHLLRFVDEAEVGSLWSPGLFPPTVPAIVRQAFTVGSPPIPTLWEPQRELLMSEQSPFDPAVKRMVLSVPTSGGKTLLAQILSVEHLARTGRSICYVAPTRSLGREIRRAFAGRLRILQRESGYEQPDFPTLEEFLAFHDSAPADVEVVTPERLTHWLRHDASAVMDRFGMFIFDEAQLLKEPGRGFTLESTIALLDHLSKDTDHKIILISAAMGNVGAIAQWLSPSGEALCHESDWRGPRRLHAVFTTKAHWDGTTRETVRSNRWRYRLRTELSGEIRLRMATGKLVTLSTQEDTGWRLVRKSRTGETEPGMPVDGGRSTKQYVIASEMIAELGHAGSVLVVTGTRSQAQQLAYGLADTLEEREDVSALVDFVRLQLSDDHPLVSVVRRGVGFHHAGLPLEVLEAMETAVRDDTLKYLTCTSTLTDGVNLPVRTVVIYDQGYPGQDENARLRGARLVNAMGRAGRAGRETEGWIVLVRGAAPSDSDFSDLNPDGDDLNINSTLISDEVLAEFADLEQEMRVNQDTLFRFAGRRAQDFISFIWHYLSVEEDRGNDPSGVDVSTIVDSTLAAQQSPLARLSCLNTAQRVHHAYSRTDSQDRRRWSRTGTSIGSAIELDEQSRQIANAILREEEDAQRDLSDPHYALKLLRPISDLFALPESPVWRFRRTPRGEDIDVLPEELLADWLSGLSLSDTAEVRLGDVVDPSWRIEQLVDAVSRHFEHYLAWVVGALVELVNRRLADAGSDEQLCPQLSAYIRYGVQDPVALIMMSSGTRSRRLAHAVARERPQETPITIEDLRSWLSTMGITGWRAILDASASEVLDLLEFTRQRRRSLLKSLLQIGSVDLDVEDVVQGALAADSPLVVEPVRGESHPAPLGVYLGANLVARVAPQDQSDLASILDTGLNIHTQLSEQHGDPARLTITLLLDGGV